MSLIYYISDLEYDVAPHFVSDKESLFTSLLDQKERINSTGPEEIQVNSTDLMYLIGLLKGHILQNLELYASDLIVAGSRFFNLPRNSAHLHNFLVPGILHEFVFGTFQNTRMSLDIFSTIYGLEIHVSYLILSKLKKSTKQNYLGLFFARRSDYYSALYKLVFHSHQCHSFVMCQSCLYSTFRICSSLNI
jgi:hypothetical protein